MRERGSIEHDVGGGIRHARSAPHPTDRAHRRGRASRPRSERGLGGRAITRDDDLDAVLAQDLDERAGSGRTGGFRVEHVAFGPFAGAGEQRADDSDTDEHHRDHDPCRDAPAAAGRHGRVRDPRVRAHASSEVSHAVVPASSLSTGRAALTRSSTAAMRRYSSSVPGRRRYRTSSNAAAAASSASAWRRKGPGRCASERVHRRAGRSVDGAALDQTSGERAEAQHDRGIPFALRRERDAASRRSSAAVRCSSAPKSSAVARARPVARGTPHTRNAATITSTTTTAATIDEPRVPSRRRAGWRTVSRRSRRSRWAIRSSAVGSAAS